MEKFFDCTSPFSPSSWFFSCSSSSNEHLLCTGAESWLIAEKTAREILSIVEPTVVSERRRWKVVNYVQNLIGGYLVDQVLPFGSMPLKTYLPHGDIDLTAFTVQTEVECLARYVCSILEGQKDQGLIQDAHFINAHVKIVKCIVQHVSVDISFNQAAGLGSLCFLEEVDRHIGRDHLFKRSIILVKAWCFYESRLLGAHSGLMSTYALETLVLYIINLFHSSLCGPLAVLYKFLDYYSTFNWDNYCISLNGPVDINFLPEIVGITEGGRVLVSMGLNGLFIPKFTKFYLLTGVLNETSKTSGGSNLLLGKDFLQSCLESFSVPARGDETDQQFPIKHFNIMDPLKGHNNLGRSITKGNSSRIKSAFRYGCQKLREILTLPAESIGDGLKTFFANTFQRNGMGQRLDAQVSAMNFNTRTSHVANLIGDHEHQIQCLHYARWYLNSNFAGDRLLSPSNLPTLFQNQTTDQQISENVFYSASENVFLPSSFCHPNASLLFHSPLGIDETTEFLGNSTNKPTTNSKKFKLRASAPPFQGTAVGKKLNSEVVGSTTLTTDTEREAKAQERDIYSPKASCSDKQMNLPETRRNSEGTTPKSSVETKPVNVSSDLEKDGEGNSFLLSPEDFPLLPRIKNPIPSDKDSESSCFDQPGQDLPHLQSGKAVAWKLSTHKT